MRIQSTAQRCNRGAQQVFSQPPSEKMPGREAEVGAMPRDRSDRLRSRRVRGFTILELVIVLLVAVLAIALVSPDLSGPVASARLKAAARDVASALRHARSEAINHIRETTFFLDVDEHYYRVSGREKSYRLPKSIRLKLFTAESEISGEGQGNIRFFPDGSSTGGRVTLEADRQQRLVDVNWLTGQVIVRSADRG